MVIWGNRVRSGPRRHKTRVLEADGRRRSTTGTQEGLLVGFGYGKGLRRREDDRGCIHIRGKSLKVIQKWRSINIGTDHDYFILSFKCFSILYPWVFVDFWLPCSGKGNVSSIWSQKKKGGWERPRSSVVRDHVGILRDKKKDGERRIGIRRSFYSPKVLTPVRSLRYLLTF